MTKTLAAWNVLDDCRNAHRMLNGIDPESSDWRVLWIGCLALLRAIGHVLDKVDSGHSAAAKHSIAKAWSEWKNVHEKEHGIFRDFIEKERNRLLKEGSFRTEPEPIYLVTEDGHRLVTEGGDRLIAEQPFFRMTLAGFEDKNGLELIAAAIAWWEQRLTEIEAAI
jgi:hypothetical protein